jgi:hypothetical protein
MPRVSISAGGRRNPAVNAATGANGIGNICERPQVQHERLKR